MPSESGLLLVRGCIAPLTLYVTILGGACIAERGGQGRSRDEDPLFLGMATVNCIVFCHRKLLPVFSSVYCPLVFFRRSKGCSAACPKLRAMKSPVPATRRHRRDKRRSLVPRTRHGASARPSLAAQLVPSRAKSVPGHSVTPRPRPWKPSAVAGRHCRHRPTAPHCSRTRHLSMPPDSW